MQGDPGIPKRLPVLIPLKKPLYRGFLSFYRNVRSFLVLLGRHTHLISKALTKVTYTVKSLTAKQSTLLLQIAGIYGSDSGTMYLNEIGRAHV